MKLNSLDVQPKLHSMMIEEGTFFKNAFVTHPVCCPSRFVEKGGGGAIHCHVQGINLFIKFAFMYRSSTLTGKYTHNHKTYENNVGRGCNAQSWRDMNEQKTIGAYMTKAGYRTGFFGTNLVC